MDRYLTGVHKTAILADWRIKVLDWEAYGRPGKGGEGYPDADIIEHVARINGLTGICVLQSCAGHQLSEDYVASGNLWLTMDKLAWLMFEEKAPLLASQQCIERLSVIYQRSGQQVLNIEFKGMADGVEMFNHSVVVITDFLLSISAS